MSERKPEVYIYDHEHEIRTARRIEKLHSDLQGCRDLIATLRTQIAEAEQERDQYKASANVGAEFFHDIGKILAPEGERKSFTAASYFVAVDVAAGTGSSTSSNSVISREDQD